MKNISIAFGALSAPIIEQLERQGVPITEARTKELNAIQKDYNAILRLRISSLITSSQCDMAVKKMIKRIDAIITQ